VIVFGLDGAHLCLVSEGKEWFLWIFDHFFVLINGAGGFLANIFLNGQFAEEDLSLRVAAGLSESEVGTGVLI